MDEIKENEAEVKEVIRGRLVKCGTKVVRCGTGKARKAHYKGGMVRYKARAPRIKRPRYSLPRTRCAEEEGSRVGGAAEGADGGNE